ncbi:ubiquitin-specific protease ubp2 [Coemansia erecta]|uniref:Ubiquitin carboxyl-terminal hydrolase n=1 Tax=Coemansia erecta TaxID=147472 RepID=A0A9W8CNR2_9FUNG|nr:ubiquitin-specific protease ubp2 [Coemansia erecta]
MTLGTLDSNTPAHSPAGVLGGYFAKTQLSSWLPASLLSHVGSPHQHTWVRPAQQQQQQQQTMPSSSTASLFQALCRDCLARLTITCDETRVSSDCVDREGHHMHTLLGCTDEHADGFMAECSGSSRCCRCAFTVSVALAHPLVAPDVAAALERARMGVHAHNPTQGARDLVATTKGLCSLARNALRGEKRATNMASERARALLKFDAPCTSILETLGFTRVDNEYRPPVLEHPTEGPLAQRRLARTCDELAVLVGRVQRRLPERERLGNFALVAVADELGRVLGAEYERRPGMSLAAALAGRSAADRAYGVLGVPADACDGSVVWAYSRLVDEEAEGESRFDALVEVAKARASAQLQALVDSERARGLTTRQDIDDACRALLGSPVDPAELTGELLRSVFLARVNETSSRDARVQLARHLSVLAAAMHDQQLAEYAQQAVASIDHVVEAPKLDRWVQLPVGLNNIGNTCYLNCMLQCLFSIAPIRHAVMRMGDGSTWNEALVEGRRDGGRLLEGQEISMAVRFVGLLKDLFENMVARRMDAWAARQAGGGASHPLAGGAGAVAVAPERELADMLLGTGGSAPRQQQDVDECMAQCVSLLEHALPPPSQDGSQDDGAAWIHRLLAGHLELATGTKQREKPSTEAFVTLSLSLPTHPVDINDCLFSFFAPSSISDHPSDAMAEASEESLRYSRIRDAPPVLCMQLQRVQFDTQALRAFKVNAHVRLRRQLSLKPFASFDAGSSDTMRRRGELQERVARVDEHLQALRVPVPLAAEEPVSVLSALSRMQMLAQGVARWAEMPAAQSLLADLPSSVMPSDSVAQSARLFSEHLGPTIKALEASQNAWEHERQELLHRLDQVYDDVDGAGDLGYTLHAVFVHSGMTPEFGHYWVYIRDYDWTRGEERWIKFNDAQVSVVDAEEVFGRMPRAGEEFDNPYYLVYVRSGELDKTVDMGV